MRKFAVNDDANKSKMRMLKAQRSLQPSRSQSKVASLAVLQTRELKTVSVICYMVMIAIVFARFPFIFIVVFSIGMVALSLLLNFNHKRTFAETTITASSVVL